ncbi:MAG: hypothetical protein JOZ50_02490, partial [Candidatus Eremiobacteraeota bacterium]|nr:hypothetical protein [Candidatus Eremiobacteraeota bacterium]
MGYHEQLDALATELDTRLRRLASSWGIHEGQAIEVALGPTRDPNHGDFATAAAMAAAKAWKRDPFEIATALASDGSLQSVAQIQAVRPGFVNITMVPGFWSGVVREVLQRGADYGKSHELESRGPMLVEFVSANPTGPLVVVQGRSSALGATLVAMLRFAGCQTSSETYVNDAGTQLDLLADSLYARYATLLERDAPLPEDGYAGEYLIDLAQALVARDGEQWLSAPQDERRAALGRFARDAIVEQQRAD